MFASHSCQLDVGPGFARDLVGRITQSLGLALRNSGNNPVEEIGFGLPDLLPDCQRNLQHCDAITGKSTGGVWRVVHECPFGNHGAQTQGREVSHLRLGSADNLDLALFHPTDPEPWR